MARHVTVRTRLVSWWAALPELTRDGWLYGMSSIFALTLAATSSQAAQWHWGYLAAAPYGVLGVVAVLAGRRTWTRPTVVRLALLLLVIIGAVAVPLGLEARWRQLDHGVGFAQPEVAVIERSAGYLAKLQDPYRAYVHDGRLVNAVPGLPAYESFFPYFPLMGIFGLPSAETHQGLGLTDARIVMSLMTMAVTGLALGLMRATRAKKLRVAQILVALPTGALFLATGGDDMPILALLLLAVVGLQRRSRYLTGVSLGLAAAMKLTAWPVAVGALLVSRDAKGRSRWRSVASVVSVIVVATIAPFVVKAPWAFMTNVFAFPLGLTGVQSPAASPLPGHLLTTWWPPAGHLLAPLTLTILGYYSWRLLRRRWPLTLSQLLGWLSVAFAVAILAASATRVGYVIYPVNLAAWSWACRVPQVDDSGPLEGGGVLVDAVGPVHDAIG